MRQWLILPLVAALYCHPLTALFLSDEPKSSTVKIDPQLTEKLCGVVTEVGYIPVISGLGNHIAVKVRTAAGEVVAQLAPEWYMDNQGITFEKNDFVQFVGVNHSDRQTGKVFIVTRASNKNKQVLFRTDDGDPVWKEWNGQ